MGKRGRTEGNELRAVNWGQWCGPFLLTPLPDPPSSIPLSLEKRLLLSSRDWDAPLTGGCYDLLQGEVGESFLHQPFFKWLQFKMLTTPGCRVLGKRVLNAVTTAPPLPRKYRLTPVGSLWDPVPKVCLLLGQLQVFQFLQVPDERVRMFRRAPPHTHNTHTHTFQLVFVLQNGLT